MRVLKPLAVKTQPEVPPSPPDRRLSSLIKYIKADNWSSLFLLKTMSPRVCEFLQHGRHLLH